MEAQNFGRVCGEVTKNVHFILTSVARDGRSDFSIISMYQTSRCRYCYSQDKDGWEIKRILKGSLLKNRIHIHRFIFRS